MRPPRAHCTRGVIRMTVMRAQRLRCDEIMRLCVYVCVCVCVIREMK